MAAKLSLDQHIENLRLKVFRSNPNLAKRVEAFGKDLKRELFRADKLDMIPTYLRDPLLAFLDRMVAIDLTDNDDDDDDVAVVAANKNIARANAAATFYRVVAPWLAYPTGGGGTARVERTTTTRTRTVNSAAQAGNRGFAQLFDAVAEPELLAKLRARFPRGRAGGLATYTAAGLLNLDFDAGEIDKIRAALTKVGLSLKGEHKER